jgi:hypothetical protein
MLHDKIQMSQILIGGCDGKNLALPFIIVKMMTIHLQKIMLNFLLPR